MQCDSNQSFIIRYKSNFHILRLNSCSMLLPSDIFYYKGSEKKNNSMLWRKKRSTSCYHIEDVSYCM